MQSGKFFFAGVGQEDCPGSIQIWRLPLDKVNEVAGHGKEVTRMRISFDNSFLFSAGKDGSLIIFDIKNKDPRGGVIKRDTVVGKDPNEVILTETSEIDESKNKVEQLTTELSNIKDASSQGTGDIMSTQKQEDEIATLDEQLRQLKNSQRNKWD